ncbi:gamma-glutamyl-gamma-aminobutyrate hydrolase family protein [Candidatus Woesearchaeota archaeon]|nr:gamma-glutamyl-gamma-aminobutyrate hydrolase family protein [Candidatus Woesearchaeota archaeon]
MIAIIDCGCPWIKNIKRCVSHLGSSYQIITLNRLPDTDFTSFSGIIISGGPTFLSQINQEEYLRNFQFIKKTDLPVLGICLGHQILGLLYGSNIYHGERTSKQEQIDLLQPSQPDELFIDVNNKSSFREEHYEFITLTDHFDLLARSDSCGNEAMKHKQKKIYSVQFHPEVSGKKGEIIFNNFLKICRETSISSTS